MYTVAHNVISTTKFDEQIVSDLHKDARGYRPTEYFWEEWSQCGDDTRQEMWDDLLVELDKELVSALCAFEEAEIVMHQRIQDMMLLGADDEISAIRWIIEGEKITKMDLAYGEDYIAYRLGLAYDNPHKSDIKAAIDSMDIDFDKLYEEELT